nr:hypothetical protein [Tanacetum cinerariifolium]
MYFKYSNGLIPPKKSRGRAAKHSQFTITPKESNKPRNKPSKKKQVLLDESLESEGELENRKESKRESRFQHKTSGFSEGAGLRPEVLDEHTGKSDVSSEGLGISSKVPDETLYNYEAQSDDDDWGSTDKETNKDKDEDDVSETEDNKGESVNKEITSMMDIEIHQVVPLVQNEPFHKVKMSVIPESTQQPPFTPRQATEDPAAPVINFEVIDPFFINFLLWNKIYRSSSKLISLQLFLSPSDPKCYRNCKEDKEKDPSARPNQGKESKKRRTRKENALSNKSLTPKESTKGKPQYKSSKIGKSAFADQSVKEPEHEGLGNSAMTSRTLRSPSKPDLAHICKISCVIRGTCNA